MKRVGAWLVGLGCLLAPTVAAARPTTDQSASLLLFPYIQVDTPAGIDTVVELANTSTTPVAVRCFLENTSSHCQSSATFCRSDSDCAVTDLCLQGWSVTEFEFSLGPNQPLGWRASSGRVPLPLLANGGPIPAVSENPFLGALRCLQVDADGAPSAGNALIGNARLETVQDGQLSDAAAYNAFGFVAADTLDADGQLEIAAGGEYSGAANISVLQFLFDGVVDPLRPDGMAQTTLVLLPVSVDYTTPAPQAAVVQTTVYNEYGFVGSTSFRLDGGHLVQQLSHLDSPRDPTRSLFYAGVSGTVAGSARLGLAGVVGLLIERRVDPGGGVLATSIRSLAGAGVRAAPDRISLTVPATATPEVEATATAEPTSSETPSATATAVSTSTPTPTFSPTPTATFTSTTTSTTVVTATPVATATTSVTATSTPVDTPVPATPSLTPTAAPECVGDCDGNGQVTVDEILRGVGVALGNLPTSACGAFDADHSDSVTVDEIVRAVANALSGCPASSP